MVWHMHSKRVKAASILLVLSAMAACTPPKEGAFFNRGGPESLLDVSSEVVNLKVDSPSKLTELSSWIGKDQPTRAELYCQAGDPRCNEARKVLELSAVPTTVVPSNDYSVALIYERILARDCDQRYIDDSHNWNHTPHPAFGCSIAANMVQHVADKQQFVNPNLSDQPDATGAVNVYHRAYTPPVTQAQQGYTVNNSTTAAAKTQ